MKKSLKILKTSSRIEKKYNKNISLYEKYLNDLKKILFSNKKSLGKGLTISSLPILLSELNINSSKELMNNINN